MTAPLTLALGATLRLSLRSSSLQTLLAERIEVTTPVTSFKRLQEGLFLFQHGQDPYHGGVYHQAPLFLMLFDLVNPKRAFFVDLLYLAVDLLAAWMLYHIAKRRSTQAASVRPALVAALYLFHPFLLATSLSRSTLTFSHAATIAALYHAIHGQAPSAMFALALATQISLYPCLLFPPLAMLAAQQRNQNVSFKTFASPAVAFTASSALLMLLSRSYLGSWAFLDMYRVILCCPDLTPNVGLWWYFFIEMFDHFRPFFLGVFQLHLASYVAPLCIKLRHTPLLVVALLLGLTATFKAYPSIGDIALFHVLLALFSEQLPYLRTPIVAVGMVAYCIGLMPAFHSLWLYTGSGNANFYYATTLVFGTGNSFAIADLLFAQLRLDFGTKYGVTDNMSILQR